MENEVTFTTQGGENVMLGVDNQGITFLHHISSGSIADMFQIGLSWASIRSLLKTLSYGKKYISNDSSIFFWKETDELYIKFRALDMHLEKVCVFSAEETIKILELLEGNSQK